MTTMYATVQIEKATIRAAAEAAHKQYPQYAGHWNDHKLAVIVSTKGLRSRGRAMWPIGTKTIATLTTVEGQTEVSAYNVEYGRDCIIGLANVRFLEE